MKLSIIILAAGQGKRMRSSMPKVLHKLAGKTLLEHVYAAANALKHEALYIIYGYGGDIIKESLNDPDVKWVYQAQQLGTGHAVQQVIDDIDDTHHVLVLYGDIPLITTPTLEQLIDTAAETGFSLLTAVTENPAGYGRIVRDNNHALIRVVEEKDAKPDEKQINEINTGMLVVDAKLLKKWIRRLRDNNAQKEFYLTDIVQMAVEESITINTILPPSNVEIHGINDRLQLAEMERYLQLIQSHQLMRNGMTIADPARFDLRGELEMGRDISVDINVILEGRVQLGNNVIIGANSIIKNTIIHDDVVIHPNCVIENSVIGRQCQIGPFARIRPETTLDDKVQIGNFVEIKKSIIGNGSKANHLSYIGDSEIGQGVNIGAGTITCNYDGAYKHKTIIEDNVFIGSDTQLVAPVTVKSGATIAAGTTITRDVDENSLAISRTEQSIVEGWQRPVKKK